MDGLMRLSEGTLKKTQLGPNKRCKALHSSPKTTAKSRPEGELVYYIWPLLVELFWLALVHRTSQEFRVL